MPAPVRCELPNVDFLTADSTTLKAYFNEFTVCLMRAWDPTLREAGFYAVRPVVNVYSSDIETPCGRITTQNAAFCSVNEQMYYATDLPRILPAEVREERMVIETIIAHEFGHAVQNRIGVLPSGQAWQNHYTSQQDQASANQMSRWMELQADCFAGEFLKSIQRSINLTQEEADAVALMFYSIGDDVLSGDPNYDGNHGHGQNRVNWLAQGFNQQHLGVCNAFVASSADTA
jgi:predicted metalloprotease